MVVEVLFGSQPLMMIEKTVLRLMIAMGVPLASALVVEQLPKTGVAEVPFAFQVENQTLPAGTYSVKQADRGRGIRIQNEKLNGIGTACAAAKRKFGRANGARLVFDSYGGHYFLTEIWFDGDGRGVILPVTESTGLAGATPAAQEVRYVRFQ
jgi:hypothetical protein